MGERRLRDIDSLDQIYNGMSLLMSAIALVAGGAGGIIIADLYGFHPVIGGVLGAAAGFGTAFLLTRVLGEKAGRAAGSIYFGSGSTMPVQREFSLAESLVVRGRLDDAVAELERGAATFPDDPEPCIRLARLLRDRCDRAEEPCTGSAKP
jgi:hypothetical protein